MKKWKRWIRFIVSIIILLLCILFSIDLMNKDTVTYEVYVSQCIDGDTAVFKTQDESFVARFLAVNAPEVDTNEYYAQEAKNYSCQLLKNAHTIVVEEDPKSPLLDPYYRRLVWVWCDGVLLQEQLVENGYAKIDYIYDYYLYMNQLYDKEEIAKQQKLGIWRNSE